MSFVTESNDGVYTKYINPVYVTAISSPATVKNLLPFSSFKPLHTYRQDDNEMSQLSSARSHRRHAELPYVIRRAGTTSQKNAARSRVSGVVKSPGRMKLGCISDVSNDLGNEPCFGVEHTQVDDSSINASKCSMPSLLNVRELSRSFRELQMSVSNVDDADSLACAEGSLNAVVKNLSDCHVTE